ncbi:tyrosinase cofactor [Streptomyces sp. NPDC102283]|uniref:apotyrosinase chaperone MelC1 n=1 Tax=Streptomyces sp. NPDC102283 TaxID=3366155 RepID=UPI0038199E56
MPGPTRRQALGAAIGVAAGGALVGVTSASADTVATGTRSGGGTAGRTGEPGSFDEVFKGRRIQGTSAETHASAHAHAGHGDGYRVLIDGRELPVMQHGKSGWSSTINHYERFATPLEAARTAVISLKGAVVVPFDPTA